MLAINWQYDIVFVLFEEIYHYATYVSCCISYVNVFFINAVNVVLSEFGGNKIFYYNLLCKAYFAKFQCL